MVLLYQITACAFVLLVAYVFFLGLGPRSNSLLYTRQQKQEWDSHIRKALGSTLVITSIFGTLTNFPTTAFMFGAVKQFGWFAAATAVTIFIGAFVTNKLTK